MAQTERKCPSAECVYLYVDARGQRLMLRFAAGPRRKPLYGVHRNRKGKAAYVRCEQAIHRFSWLQSSDGMPVSAVWDRQEKGFVILYGEARPGPWVLVQHRHRGVGEPIWRVYERHLMFSACFSRRYDEQVAEAQSVALLPGSGSDTGRLLVRFHAEPAADGRRPITRPTSPYDVQTCYVQVGTSILATMGLYPGMELTPYWDAEHDGFVAELPDSPPAAVLPFPRAAR